MQSAAMHTSVGAASLRAPIQCRKTTSPSARRVVCRAEAQGAHQDVVKSITLFAASVAAAALLSTGSANAGVVLEKTSLKKVFQDAPAAPAGQKAPAAKSSGSSFSAPSLPSFSPGLIALPASIAAIGGGAFVLSKLDSGFGEFFSETIVKDSSAYAGYEDVLKSVDGPKAKAKTAIKKATAKVTGKTGKK